MAKKRTVVYERQNEVFHVKLYGDGMAEVVDIEDKETININADRLPSLKALIDDMEKFRKGGRK